jgi:hypothetical protein
MNKITIFISILILTNSITLFSQTDMHDIFDSTKGNSDWKENILTVVESTYGIFIEGISSKMDTTITYNDEIVELTKLIMSHKKSEKGKILSAVETHLGGMNSYHTSVDSFNLSGKMVYNKKIYEGDAADMLNQISIVEYNDKGKILALHTTRCDTCQITTMMASYRADGDFDIIKLNMDGLGDLQFIGNDEGSLVVYGSKFIPKADLDEFSKMLVDKISESEEKTERSTQGDFYIYKSFKKNKESKQFKLESEITRNKSFKVTEKKVYYDEVLSEHKKFSYNKWGKVQEIYDVMSEVTQNNVYDIEGKPLTVFEEWTKSEYKYDNKGNWVEKITTSSDSLTEITFRTITYK